MQQRIPYTAFDHVLRETVNGIFDRLYNRRMMIRLIVVRFSELVSGAPRLALFDDNMELTQLYAALDKIKFREKDSRTSIVFNTKNESGALLKILEIFKKYNLNLVYLESRPSKKVFGEYNFFSDIDKGRDEILSSLKEIWQECNFYKLLGSYPVIE